MSGKQGINHTEGISIRDQKSIKKALQTSTWNPQDLCTDVQYILMLNGALRKEVKCLIKNILIQKLNLRKLNTGGQISPKVLLLKYSAVLAHSAILGTFGNMGTKINFFVQK